MKETKNHTSGTARPGRRGRGPSSAGPMLREQHMRRPSEVPAREARQRGGSEADVSPPRNGNPITKVEVGSKQVSERSPSFMSLNSQVKEGQILGELDLLQFESRVETERGQLFEAPKHRSRRPRSTLANLQRQYEKVLESLRERPDLLRGERHGRSQLSRR